MNFAGPSRTGTGLAAGTIAGHIIECGAQCTGGNYSVDWQALPDMANVGFPVVEASESGDFVVSKHPGTGGRITLASIKEQLLYELGDPKAYLTPDCSADFTSIALRDDGPDRVAVEGVRGGQRPPTLKTSITYAAGYQAVGTLVYSWPDAAQKARAADRIVRQRLDDLGLRFDEVQAEVLGLDACHGPVAAPNPDPPEVQLRMGVRAAETRPGRAFQPRDDPTGAERAAHGHRLRRRPATRQAGRCAPCLAAAPRGDQHERGSFRPAVSAPLRQPSAGRAACCESPRCASRPR